MIGKKVRILRGDCYGKTGEVVDNTTFPGVKDPVYRVWLGGDSTGMYCKKEMEVLA